MATDQGVRKGLTTTEFLVFLICGIMLTLNGTVFVTIPRDQLTNFFTLAGVYIAGRAGQKGVAVFTSGRAGAEPKGERRDA